MNTRFDYTIIDAINNAMRAVKASPLVLGGVASSGGGAGGPVGGFVGKLPQSRVTYDLSELASSGISVSGSLVDNLNHIRYRLGVIESGGIPTDFLDLSDTPSSYSGQTGKAVIVNALETGLEFGDVSTSGITVYTESNTPPVSASGGDRWFHTESGILFTYVSDDDSSQWVELSPAGMGIPGPSGIQGVAGSGAHTVMDEGSPLTQRTYLNFVGSGVTVIDNSGSDETTVTIPATAVGMISITYSGLTNLITASGLSPGQCYCITDFQTVYDQPDFDSGGAEKETVTTKTGDLEPLVVLAIDNDHISTRADSTVYPDDQIKYDVTFSVTEIMGVAAKGRIAERIDNFNNRTDYDHRAVLFKRYESSEGSGVFNSYKDNGEAFAEYKTFQSDTDEYSNNNYLGDYAVLYALWPTSFILSNNVFGEYSEFNVFKIAYNNTIGDSAFFNTLWKVYGNTIGSSFSNNKSNLNVAFNFNTIANSFHHNKLGSEFAANVVAENNFRYNDIKGSVASTTFSAGAHVYGNYSKTITNRLDGTLRLTYMNNSDVFVVVAVTA